MDYHHMTTTSSWSSDQQQPQQPQMIQIQPQQIQTTSQVVEQGQHSQNHPIVYGITTQHTTMAPYEVPVSWPQQTSQQNVMQVSQWTENHHPVGRTMAMNPNIQPTVSDACVLPNPQRPHQQSQYAQYSTPSYWTNSALVDEHPQIICPTTPAGAGSTAAQESNTHLVEPPYVTQPVASTAMQSGMHDMLIVEPSSSLQHQQTPDQFNTQDATAAATSSCQPGPIPQCSISDGQESLEDALEVIRNHAENFSGHHTSSSLSGDDEADPCRGRKGNEREKERRQANNARER